MLRGPLGQNKYKPKFSGHDTFPFRYAWLTKFIHYVEDGNIKKIKEFEKKYPDENNVPRPNHWGGYKVLPNLIEFWQGRQNRLHDRISYESTIEGWVFTRLSP